MKRDLTSVVRSYFASECWAMQTAAFDAFAGSVAEVLEASNPQAYSGPLVSRQSLTQIAGSTAVIPVTGTLTARPNLLNTLMGGCSCLEVSNALREATANGAVKSIVLDIDSPGGTVQQVAELADRIYFARSKKPIVAVVNSMAASAAYWLAASCSKIAITPSGQVGSIGIFSVHTDMSAALAKEGVKPTLISAGKYKTEGNPFEPLSASARAATQSMVDDYYGMFTRSVAKGRNVPVESVRNGFGEGRMVTAQTAVKSGMADKIVTLQQAVLGAGGKSSVAASLQPGIVGRCGDLRLWVRLWELEGETKNTWLH